jgi:hypothetical protein
MVSGLLAGGLPVSSPGSMIAVLARPHFIGNVDEVQRLLSKMTGVNRRLQALVPVMGLGYTPYCGHA